jgi:hypothetical protein
VARGRKPEEKEKNRWTFPVIGDLDLDMGFMGILS